MKLRVFAAIGCLVPGTCFADLVSSGMGFSCSRVSDGRVEEEREPLVYPGQVSTSVTVQLKTRASSTLSAGPSGPLSVLTVDSAHMANSSRRDSNSYVESVLVFSLSADALYDLSGNLTALPEAESGLVYLHVELVHVGTWDWFYYQDSAGLIDAEHRGLVVGEDAGGSIFGELRGRLAARETYMFSFITRLSPGVFEADARTIAAARFELAPVPGPGFSPLAVLPFALRRRRYSTA